MLVEALEKSSTHKHHTENVRSAPGQASRREGGANASNHPVASTLNAKRAQGLGFLYFPVILVLIWAS